MQICYISFCEHIILLSVELQLRTLFFCLYDVFLCYILVYVLFNTKFCQI